MTNKKERETARKNANKFVRNYEHYAEVFAAVHSAEAPKHLIHASSFFKNSFYLTIVPILDKSKTTVSMC